MAKLTKEEQGPRRPLPLIVLMAGNASWPKFRAGRSVVLKLRRAALQESNND